MGRKIGFVDDAYEEYEDWRDRDEQVFLKIKGLIKECSRTPTKGTGKPEPLRGSLKGLYSRRINQEHRLVYSFTNDELEILSCYGHYGDK
ncbi:Txe/YoeB family addiction module toxin [Spirosoma sp. 48-14]|uniref:Txe/YoeB family addiction module toxin n=1 Tax=Spirosoma sp. 48-14 TaxID=1895854 RepID=UPI000961E886|nr:Txe/YoeB family addiction module toxin [Spirosoma sp. 48-14]OJW78445.1 MAG: hypothetical protein BGO59_31065 [Spirosoma sp. 48-14]